MNLLDFPGFTQFEFPERDEFPQASETGLLLHAHDEIDDGVLTLRRKGRLGEVAEFLDDRLLGGPVFRIAPAVFDVLVKSTAIFEMKRHVARFFSW